MFGDEFREKKLHNRVFYLLTRKYTNEPIECHGASGSIMMRAQAAKRGEVQRRALANNHQLNERAGDFDITIGTEVLVSPLSKIDSIDLYPFRMLGNNHLGRAFGTGVLSPMGTYYRRASKVVGLR